MDITTGLYQKVLLRIDWLWPLDQVKAEAGAGMTEHRLNFQGRLQTSFSISLTLPPYLHASMP